MRKLIILFVFLPFLASAQVKISALPEATSVGSSDLFILNQSGTTKKLPYSLLQGTYVSTTVFNDTVSALKNRTIWGLNANSTGTGSRKVLIGESAGLATTENNLIGIGYNAFYNASSTSLDYGIAIGMNAGYGASGLSNFFGGYNSGHSNTGNYSTLLGSFSGRSNTNGQLTAIGYYSGYYNTGSNATGIGSYSNYRNTGTYTTSLGSYAGYYTSGAGISGNNNTFVGYYATSSAPAVINSTAIGANATVSLDSTVVLGNNADTYVTKDLYLTGNFSSLGDSVYLLSDLSGQDAKFDTLQADYFIGAAIVAGSNTQIQYNDNGVLGASENFTWNDTTLKATSSIGSVNMNIGDSAGYTSTTGAVGNMFVGIKSGYSNGNADKNTFFGYKTGESTSALENTFMGYLAGNTSTSGGYNVFVGSSAGGGNTSGSSNVYIGRESGGSKNGTGNIAIGNSAGRYGNGSYNVLIGYLAGQNSVGSNKLYIDNSGSATPLIYGEFDNNKVKVNGYFEADSSYMELQNLSAGRVNDLALTTADTWETIKLDTLYESVTTDSLRFNSDSTGIEVRFDGYCSFNGHATVTNSTADSVTAIIYLRLLLNDVEVSRFNTIKSRTFAANGTDDLTSYDGVFEVSKGDVVKIQMRTSDTNIILAGLNNGIFTQKTPFNIRLEQKFLNK